MGRGHDRMDPELRAFLEAEPSRLAGVALTGKSLSEKRRAMDQMCHHLMKNMRPNDQVEIEDRMVIGPLGAPDVRVRIYRPAGQNDALPGLCWLHGGGMIMGKPELCDLVISRYVELIGCVVVSVDYRLAPESRHPAPVEDCYAALSWMSAHADELRIDASRIAIGGESAGGGLAAATALLARDRGGPALIFQFLIYPMLDDRSETPSTYEATGIGVWDRADNVEAWQALLGARACGEEVSPYAAPARAEDLAGLPPAYVDVGELDIFRDEDIVYATRLLQAGVAVELHVIPGVFHGWDMLAPKVGVTKRATAARRDALGRALYPISCAAN